VRLSGPERRQLEL